MSLNRANEWDAAAAKLAASRLKCFCRLLLRLNDYVFRSSRSRVVDKQKHRLVACTCHCLTIGVNARDGLVVHFLDHISTVEIRRGCSTVRIDGRDHDSV